MAQNESDEFAAANHLLTGQLEPVRQFVSGWIAGQPWQEAP